MLKIVLKKILNALIVESITLGNKNQIIKKYAQAKKCNVKIAKDHSLEVIKMHTIAPNIRLFYFSNL